MIARGVDGPQIPDAEFQDRRAGAATLLRFEAAPLADAGMVNKQLDQTLVRLSRPRASAALRLLVRNAFLLSGGAARMSNRGDNSDWAEVVTTAPNRPELIGAIQIDAEISLDAHRRLLAGLAIAASRHGANLSEIVPIIVMRTQPNLRTDYYRVLSDATKYLRVRIRTVPLAAIYLGIRLGGTNLLETIEAGAYVDAEHPSNEEWIERAFGAPHGSVNGASPIK